MSAGRMNIEVTATTGKFAAQMKRVRAEMATTARAAGKGFSIGGMGRLGGPLGAVGESIGVLSGPMMALVAGLADLSVAMRALTDRMEAGRENLSEMRLLGLGVEEQARLRTIGQVIRPDATGADALGLRDKFAEVAPGFGMNIAGLDLAAQFDAMRKAAQSADALTIAEQMGGKAGEDFMRLRMVEEAFAMGPTSGAAVAGADALTIAEQLGGKGGEDFMRLRMMDPQAFATSTSGAAVAGAFAEERLRQQQAAARDPNDPSMIRDILDFIARQIARTLAENAVRVSPTGRSDELDELRRMNQGLTRQGPGI